jgi:hypothetical protein
VRVAVLEQFDTPLPEQVVDQIMPRKHHGGGMETHLDRDDCQVLWDAFVEAGNKG